jgi:D-amino-acid dehydrogenase
MRIAVLGGGVIGVTSAYYLAKAGHSVTVVERLSGPARDTSFANAGQISPGYASPWAAPDVPRKALKWLFMRHAPLILRPKADPAMISWLIQLLSNCTHAAYAVNKQRMVRLATYSRQQLELLRLATGIQYDARTRGTLQLFRTQHQLDAVAKDVAVLKQGGVPFEVLDRAGCIVAEPGLANAAEPFVGGLRLPGDETGDCFKFTQALVELAKAEGINFRYDETVESLVTAGGRIEAALTSQGPLAADAFVVALGSYSPSLVAPLGIRLPIYPVKGYSLTAKIIAEDRAPVSTVLDESYKVAITRLGNRIRVGGMAEVSGFTYNLPVARRRTLERSVDSLFPRAGALAEAQFWSGLRPMTPDGTPTVGATTVPNLFLNAGHGTLGWTMACGSARVLADIVGGVEPEIEVGDLAVSRYGYIARSVDMGR